MAKKTLDHPRPQPAAAEVGRHAQGDAADDRPLEGAAEEAGSVAAQQDGDAFGLEARPGGVGFEAGSEVRDVDPGVRLHSARRDSTGSMRVARSAGMSAAQTA